MGGGSSDPLIGRDRDIERLASFIDHASGQGGAMLVSGDPGVGKTALLDVAARHAESSGTRLLRATGAEFEANVSFAGLNQLLHPLFDEIDQLRPAHAEALRVSLGLRDGPRSDQLVASNAALALLVHAASDSPVLALVDDLPWVDRASSAVLAFIARRTAGTRVGFLAALRTGSETVFERAGLLDHHWSRWMTLLPQRSWTSGSQRSPVASANACSRRRAGIRSRCSSFRQPSPARNTEPLARRPPCCH